MQNQKKDELFSKKFLSYLILSDLQNNKAYKKKPPPHGEGRLIVRFLGYHLEMLYCTPIPIYGPGLLAPKL